MKFNTCIYAVLLLVFAPAVDVKAQELYYPGSWGNWETRTPAQVGMDAELVLEAVQFAKSAENQDSKKLEQVAATSFANEPFNTIVGPESSYYAAGFGGNYIYVDPENDLLIVLRWTPDIAGVVKRFVAAIEPRVDSISDD